MFTRDCSIEQTRENTSSFLQTGKMLDHLPQDALLQMFAKEPVALRCTLACTCKRLRDVSLMAGFWDDIKLDLASLRVKSSFGVAAMLHFLAKRVTSKSRITLICSASRSQQDAHRPAVMQACEWPYAAIVPLLLGSGINPGVKNLSLNLDNLGMETQTEVLRVLPWLTALKQLSVDDVIMADASQLNALNQLSDLEDLALRFNPQAAILVRQSLQGGFPERLAGLTQLRCLTIHHAGFLGDLPEELSALAKLRSLDLSQGSIVTGMPMSLSVLESLSSVKVEHYGSNPLAVLAWLPSLRELHLSSQRIPVELASCSQLTALTLQQLGDVPEHQIEIGFSRMLGFSKQSDSWRGLLPKMLPEQPRLHDQLRVLYIADTKLGSVPQAVAQLPHLEHLSLNRCSLFDLPAGPYISNLKTLGLKQNFFIEIPHSLAGASSLGKVDLSYNLLRPSEVDIETVLQLPSLQHLWVTKATPQSGPERFRLNLNNWTAYSVNCLFKLAARHAAIYPGQVLSIDIFEASPEKL